MEDTKRCPYCAETIQAAARICRFCNRDLENPQAPQPQTIKKRDATAGSLATLISLLIGGAWWFYAGGSTLLMPNSATESSSPSPASIFAPAARSVTYMVTGTAPAASITYNNPQGGTIQTESSLPWYETMTFKDGDFVYVSAQNKGESGSVTTQILIDSVAWKRTTSSGLYVIADCNGSVAKP